MLIYQPCAYVHLLKHLYLLIPRRGNESHIKQHLPTVQHTGVQVVQIVLCQNDFRLRLLSVSLILYGLKIECNILSIRTIILKLSFCTSIHVHFVHGEIHTFCIHVAYIAQVMHVRNKIVTFKGVT